VSVTEPQDSTQVESSDLKPASVRAVKRIRKHVIGKGTKYNDEDERTNVKDLLTDILHLCDKAKIDFDDVVDDARRMYDDEIARPTWA